MFWLRNKKNNFQLRTLIWGGGGAGCVIKGPCMDPGIFVVRGVQVSLTKKKSSDVFFLFFF